MALTLRRWRRMKTCIIQVFLALTLCLLPSSTGIKCHVCGGYDAWDSAWGVTRSTPNLSNPLQRAYATPCPPSRQGKGTLIECLKSKPSCMKGDVISGSRKILVRGCYHKTHFERCPHPPDHFHFPGLKDYCVCTGPSPEADGCNGGRRRVGPAEPFLPALTGILLTLNYILF